MKRVTYQEAFDYVLERCGWSYEALEEYAKGGKVLIMNMYDEYVHGYKTNLMGRDTIITKSGQQITGPVYCSSLNEASFEDVVRNEFQKFGYSDTLDFSIEESIAEKTRLLTEGVDTSEEELLLEYLRELQTSLD